MDGPSSQPFPHPQQSILWALTLFLRQVQQPELVLLPHACLPIPLLSALLMYAAEMDVC